MFKYPLAVTIDTNIFDAAKFDLSDNSTIRLLENYVKKGKIKVILSEIVIRESKRPVAINRPEHQCHYRARPNNCSNPNQCFFHLCSLLFFCS